MKYSTKDVETIDFNPRSIYHEKDINHQDKPLVELYFFEEYHLSPCHIACYNPALSTKRKDLDELTDNDFKQLEQFENFKEQLKAPLLFLG